MQPLAQLHAVGQARQDVVMRQKANLFIGSVLFGNVIGNQHQVALA